MATVKKNCFQGVPIAIFYLLKMGLSAMCVLVLLRLNFKMNICKCIAHRKVFYDKIDLYMSLFGQLLIADKLKINFPFLLLLLRSNYTFSEKVEQILLSFYNLSPLACRIYLFCHYLQLLNFCSVKLTRKDQLS